MILTLENVKKYLNIDSDFQEDDELIINLIDAAEKAIKKNLNREELSGFTDEEIDSDIQNAALMLIAELYKNREFQTVNSYKESPVFMYLIGPNKEYNSFGAAPTKLSEE